MRRSGGSGASFSRGRLPRLARRKGRGPCPSSASNQEEYFLVCPSLPSPDLGIAAAASVQLGGVDRDGVFDLFEEVLVVHDVAEILPEDPYPRIAAARTCAISINFGRFSDTAGKASRNTDCQNGQATPTIAAPVAA